MSSTDVGLFTRVSTVWQRAVPSVKVAGVWTEGIRMYTKVAGVWKVVWANAQFSLGAPPNLTLFAADPISPFSEECGWRSLAGGSIQTKTVPPDADVYVDNGNWLLYELGRSYEVKFHIVSGTFATTPTLDTWLTTGSTRTFTRTGSGGFTTGKMEVQWREVGGSVLKTINVTMNTEGSL